MLTYGKGYGITGGPVRGYTVIAPYWNPSDSTKTELTCKVNSFSKALRIAQAGR